VREIIYIQLFSAAPQLKLLSPVRKRLRSSRPAPDETRGLLDTCRLLRNEALPVYYSLSCVCFRSSDHLITFVKDPRLDTCITTSIKRLALDFGDTAVAPAVETGFRDVLASVVKLPKLQTFEMRFYALMTHSRQHSEFLRLTDVFGNLTAASGQCPSRVKPCEQSLCMHAMVYHGHERQVAEALARRGFELTYFQSSADYEDASKDILRCCTIALSKSPYNASEFAKAETAVMDRRAVVGKLTIGMAQLCETRQGEVNRRLRTMNLRR